MDGVPLTEVDEPFLESVTEPPIGPTPELGSDFDSFEAAVEENIEEQIAIEEESTTTHENVDNFGDFADAKSGELLDPDDFDSFENAQYQNDEDDGDFDSYDSGQRSHKENGGLSSWSPTLGHSGGPAQPSDPELYKDTKSFRVDQPTEFAMEESENSHPEGKPPGPILSSLSEVTFESANKFHSSDGIEWYGKSCEYSHGDLKWNLGLTAKLRKPDYSCSAVTTTTKNSNNNNNNTQFVFNVCRPNFKRCNGNLASIAAYHSEEDFPGEYCDHILGKDPFPNQVSLLDKIAPSKGLNLTYVDGSPCTVDNNKFQQRVTSILFECDDKQSKSGVSIFCQSINECRHEIKITGGPGHAICPVMPGKWGSEPSSPVDLTESNGSMFAFLFSSNTLILKIVAVGIVLFLVAQLVCNMNRYGFSFKAIPGLGRMAREKNSSDEEEFEDLVI